MPEKYDQVRDDPNWARPRLGGAHDLMPDSPEHLLRILLEAGRRE